MVPERILIIHNYYLQAGGESTVFEAEKRLLLKHGHHVDTFTVSNSSLERMRPAAQLLNALWNFDAYREVRALIRDVRPDIVHFHNTFPLLSPSVYYAVQAEGVPVVQTVHNYRMLCVNGLLFRGGHVCEDCIGKLPWRGVLHRCYRSSTRYSLAVALLLAVHRMLRTWQTKVDAYIALTEFALRQLVRGGLPESRIHLKPNFTQETAHESRVTDRNHVLFVGRLAEEKGIGTLLDAWRELADIPLVIIGDGPQRSLVEAYIASAGTAAVTYHGAQPHEEVLKMMRQARLLVFPSQWYEGFPMTLIEAFASSVPVVAPNLGAMASIIQDEVNGLHFSPGDIRDLARQVRWAWEHPEKLQKMSEEAYRISVEKYSAEQNYQQLMLIYRKAAARRKAEDA